MESKLKLLLYSIATLLIVITLSITSVVNGKNARIQRLILSSANPTYADQEFEAYVLPNEAELLLQKYVTIVLYDQSTTLQHVSGPLLVHYFLQHSQEAGADRVFNSMNTSKERSRALAFHVLQNAQFKMESLKEIEPSEAVRIFVVEKKRGSEKSKELVQYLEGLKYESYLDLYALIVAMDEFSELPVAQELLAIAIHKKLGTNLTQQQLIDFSQIALSIDKNFNVNDLFSTITPEEQQSIVFANCLMQPSFDRFISSITKVDSQRRDLLLENYLSSPDISAKEIDISSIIELEDRVLRDLQNAKALPQQEYFTLVSRLEVILKAYAHLRDEKSFADLLIKSSLVLEAVLKEHALDFVYIANSEVAFIRIAQEFDICRKQSLGQLRALKAKAIEYMQTGSQESLLVESVLSEIAVQLARAKAYSDSQEMIAWCSNDGWRWDTASRVFLECWKNQDSVYYSSLLPDFSEVPPELLDEYLARLATERFSKGLGYSTLSIIHGIRSDGLRSNLLFILGFLEPQSLQYCPTMHEAKWINLGVHVKDCCQLRYTLEELVRSP